jgi:hypothetical protein
MGGSKRCYFDAAFVETCGSEALTLLFDHIKVLFSWLDAGKIDHVRSAIYSIATA